MNIHLRASHIHKSVANLLVKLIAGFSSLSCRDNLIFKVLILEKAITKCHEISKDKITFNS